MSQGSSPVAIVTGGGTGIGAATSRHLARDGYQVAVCGRRTEPLATVADEIGGMAIAADLREPEAADRMLREAVSQLGPPRALVLNAGVFHPGTVADLPPDDWEDTLKTNLTGSFFVVRAALPFLLEQQGAVVSIASLSALRLAPASVAYCASKAGLTVFTQALALDHGPAGLRANVVCPGWVRTEMAEGEMAELAAKQGISVEEAYERMTALVPQRRAGEPDEIASAVSWLVSDAASYVNGAVLCVDGGTALVDAGTALG